MERKREKPQERFTQAHWIVNAHMLEALIRRLQ